MNFVIATGLQNGRTQKKPFLSLMKSFPMKKNLHLISFILPALIVPFTLWGQGLKPGFDKAEYRDMVLVSARSTKDTAYYEQLPAPEKYRMVYQSGSVGLDNSWDLWKGPDGIAAISIRGTTEHAESWLANIYAAMVPAAGELKLSATNTFHYRLADDPKAAVHVGWLISMACLSEDIIAKMDSCYRAGTKNFLIMGHSQGGAIAYLLTAYLYHLQAQHQLPADIRFKTYCSASPKPGNLYFAYDYEILTQNGWAYNVVNSADWVPEAPISIQTLHDFNTMNPFLNAKQMIHEQKFPKNLVMKHIYNSLDKPTRKAQRTYEKYLGRMTSGLIGKYLPGFEAPDYYSSNHYVRTGTTVVLNADKAYYEKYPGDPKAMFPHHAHGQYVFLIDKLKY
jgi:hypothetical protein